MFVKEGDDGLYRKYEETHYQRAYRPEEIREIGERAGMEFLAFYHAFTYEAPREDSERIYAVFREKGKTERNEAL